MICTNDVTVAPSPMQLLDVSLNELEEAFALDALDDTQYFADALAKGIQLAGELARKPAQGLSCDQAEELIESSGREPGPVISAARSTENQIELYSFTGLLCVGLVS